LPVTPAKSARVTFNFRSFLSSGMTASTQTRRTPGKTRWSQIDSFVAGITIFDGLLGLAVWAWSGNARGALPLLALLGLLAGVAAWRGRAGGYLAALAFYGLHLASYHAYDATAGYHLRGPLSLGVVVHGADGVLVVNAFAVVMFMASAALLWRRARSGRSAHSTYQ
jgi:hypothetical protein